MQHFLCQLCKVNQIFSINALTHALSASQAVIEISICCKSSPYPCGNILVIAGYYIIEHTTPKTKTLKFKRAQLQKSDKITPRFWCVVIIKNELSGEVFNDCSTYKTLSLIKNMAFKAILTTPRQPIYAHSQVNLSSQQLILLAYSNIGKVIL